MPLRWTRQALLARLVASGFRPRKSLGQNFLVDENFLAALVRDLKLGPQEDVVEIGSGPGSLTAYLAPQARQVWAFEVDERLVTLGREALAECPNVSWIRADGAQFERHIRPPGPVRVVSNLPYSDWQRLTLAILSTPLTVSSYVLMVQSDVYDRIRARPGTRDYGPWSALLGATCEIRKLREAGRKLFWPIPRVDSVVFELWRGDARRDFALAFGELRGLFGQRRKKSKAAGGRRIEELSPQELLALLSPGGPRGPEGQGGRPASGPPGPI